LFLDGLQAAFQRGELGFFGNVAGLAELSVSIRPEPPLLADLQ